MENSQAGKYFISVESTNSSAGQFYELTSKIVESEGSSNSTISSATNLGWVLTSKTADGFIGDDLTIAAGADVDMYRFVVPSDGRYMLSAAARVFGSEVDTRLKLFDRDGTVIANNDDNSEANDPSFIVDLEKGEYFVGIAAYRNDYDPILEGTESDEGVTGSYQLGIVRVLPTAQEANDTIATATPVFEEKYRFYNPYKTDGPVQEGERVFLERIGDNLTSGNVSDDPLADLDFYKVTVNENSFLTLDIDANFPGGSIWDPYMSLFDADGNRLATSDDEEAPGELPSYDSFLSGGQLDPGTYYIAVSTRDNRNFDPTTGEPGSGISNANAGDFYELAISVGEVMEDSDTGNRLKGSSGGDYIDGGGGEDYIRGLRGNDIVQGGSGDDSINGGSGDDLIAGQEGNDSIRGGSGSDIFMIEEGEGTDIILDFEDGIDFIGIDSGSNIDYILDLIISTAGSESTKIQYGGETLAVLVGVNPLDINEDDFRVLDSSDYFSLSL